MGNHIVPSTDVKRALAPQEFNLDYEKVIDLKVRSDEDAEIIKFLTSVITPYSEFQSKAFVINTEVTDHRKIQQCALEIKARIQGLAESTYKVKKAEIQKRQLQRDLEKEEDDLERELLQLEIDKISFDIQQTKLLQEQSNYEIMNFLDICKQIAPENTLETILSYKDNWEEKEEEYWVKRFGKQAMYDILLSGKVQTGNLDAIIGMPIESQQKAISYAILQTQKMEKGITELSEAVRNVLLSSNDTTEKLYELPDISGITGVYGGKPHESNKTLQIERKEIDEKITFDTATSRLRIR